MGKIISVRAEINETKPKRDSQRIEEAKLILTKDKEDLLTKREKTQINKVRGKKGDITTDNYEIYKNSQKLQKFMAIPEKL